MKFDRLLAFSWIQLKMTFCFVSFMSSSVRKNFLTTSCHNSCTIMQSKNRCSTVFLGTIAEGAEIVSFYPPSEQMTVQNNCSVDQAKLKGSIFRYIRHGVNCLQMFFDVLRVYWDNVSPFFR